MKNNISRIAFLISFSLLSIIGLQIFYAIEMYKQQSALFTSEVNQAFERAVIKTNEQRLKKINSFFEEDISDTSQVKLVYELNDEGHRLVVIDPNTAYKLLSLGIQQPKDSLPDRSELIQIAVNENWKLLRNENILYWTQTIGEKLKAYSDSLSISRDSLRRNMKDELLLFGIKENFSFVKSDSTHQYDSTDQSFKIKMLPVKIEGETLLSAKIDNPQRPVIKRLMTVFVLTIVALTLLFFSFSYLYRILRKQRHISALKDDFIDNVTHELITPTATLQLALETLEKSEHSCSSKYISIAKQHADRIANIVDQVLKSSLNQLENEHIQLEKLDLNSLLIEIIQYYRSTYGDVLKIESNLKGTQEVYTHREYLSTVLHNIISNAIKYGNLTNPEVKIWLDYDVNYFSICVQDNGSGIPKAHQQKIFDKLHRVPSAAHDVKGLGIGLYNAKMLMLKIKGDISLKSSTQLGSCFCIHLPKTKL